MTDADLKQLIANCRKFDPVSQKEIYRHFYNYGMTICYRYAQNTEEAREVFNDGFVKAFMKLDKYKQESSFKSWLSRILVNTAIDSYRKKQSRPQTVDLIYAQHVETAPSALDLLTAKDVLNLVQKLAPSYRMAFNLHVVEGYTHPEIAKKLGISEGTSKSNLAKARIKLKAMLQLLDEKKSKYG
ncbi:MAG: RNA polymerase sigma factor (sigma-70 family) [Polaribacter sp.]|jgi:RNA polymerase sigma factor (sigma-70 family)